MLVSGASSSGKEVGLPWTPTQSLVCMHNMGVRVRQSQYSLISRVLRAEQVGVNGSILVATSRVV